MLKWNLARWLRTVSAAFTAILNYSTTLKHSSTTNRTDLDIRYVYNNNLHNNALNISTFLRFFGTEHRKSWHSFPPYWVFRHFEFFQKVFFPRFFCYNLLSKKFGSQHHETNLNKSVSSTFDTWDSLSITCKRIYWQSRQTGSDGISHQRCDITCEQALMIAVDSGLPPLLYLIHYCKLFLYCSIYKKHHLPFSCFWKCEKNIIAFIN